LTSSEGGAPPRHRGGDGTPSFWDDGRRAQELTRERSELARTVARFRELMTQAESSVCSSNWAGETGDESVTPEIEEGVSRVRQALDDFELKIMPRRGARREGRDRVDSSPAPAAPSRKTGPQILMRMYLRWCERAGFTAEVVDLQPGEEAGIKSATITVQRRVRLRLPQGGDRRAPTRPDLALRRPEATAHELRLGVGDPRGRGRRGRGAGRRDPRRTSSARPAPAAQGVNTADSRGPDHAPPDRDRPCSARTSAPSSANRDTAMRIPEGRGCSSSPSGSSARSCRS